MMWHGLLLFVMLVTKGHGLGVFAHTALFLRGETEIQDERGEQGAEKGGSHVSRLSMGRGDW